LPDKENKQQELVYMAEQKTAQLREKVVSKIITVSRRFHYEPLTSDLDERMPLPKNISLMALSYLLDGNHLIKGDPGFGKSTGAKIISSVFGGVPYDLYHSLELQGHSGQVKEHAVGRLDFSTESAGENMIWMGTIALPVLHVDEGNRLPPETQGGILQGLETKRWNYSGNHTYYAGPKPAFITVNYHDEGTERFLPPLLDRMDIVTENQYTGRNNFITNMTYELAKSERRRLLRDDAITNEAMKKLNKKGIEEFVKYCKENRLKMVGKITDEEKAEIFAQIDAVSVSKKGAGGSLVSGNDALLFLSAFDAEINWSEKYGSKRSADTISDHSHDRKYIGVDVKGGFSPRSLVAALRYAKGVAWLSGRDELDIRDVVAVLPHAIAHKTAFSEKFVKDAEGRNEMLELALARKLVGKALENYRKAADGIKGLLAKIQEAPQEIMKFDIGKYDHPLQKSLISTVKDEFSKHESYGDTGLEETV